jgi:hypothetical protein
LKCVLIEHVHVSQFTCTCVLQFKFKYLDVILQVLFFTKCVKSCRLNTIHGDGCFFSEKVPIHFRSNKKQIVPAAASAHDLSTPPDIVQDVEECGRSSRSSSHLSPNTQKAPAFLPG